MSLRLVSSLVLCFVVGGCQTQATRIANQMQADIDAGADRAAECFDIAKADPSTAPLKAKLHRDFIRPPLAQLSDKKRASKAERVALFRYSELVRPCRQIVIDTLQKTHSLSATAFVNAYAHVDAVYAQLVARKTAWGSANKRLAAIFDSLKVETDRFDSIYRRDLREAYIMELQQRRTAVRAMQKWAEQQQVLQSLKPTRHADCGSPGSSINCASD